MLNEFRDQSFPVLFPYVEAHHHFQHCLSQLFRIATELFRFPLSHVEREEKEKNIPHQSLIGTAAVQANDSSLSHLLRTDEVEFFCFFVIVFFWRKYFDCILGDFIGVNDESVRENNFSQVDSFDLVREIVSNNRFLANKKSKKKNLS